MPFSILNSQFSILKRPAFFLLFALALSLQPLALSSAPVTVTETADAFTLANGILIAEIDKHSGTLISLKFANLEFLSSSRAGSEGGYWSSVGRGRPGPNHSATIRLNPKTNGGARAEISCRLANDPQSPAAPVDVDYRYSLGRGESWLYVYSVLEHKPDYPAFGVGEARYCLKLNPDVFDYLTVDANRRRIMPSGYDWDHGQPLNLKEARRMTTGVHAGEPEHKYDYSAVFSETPAYGWSSTKQGVGLWLINPSLEYIGGGPTKAELTGHLDVNPGGLPTLLNMWVGSHYGGTTVAVATNETWVKVVGPFLLYCNQDKNARKPRSKVSIAQSATRIDDIQRGLWQDALVRATNEFSAWPYGWVNDSNYPAASARATIRGSLVVTDPFEPALKISNVWVGVTAPDYIAPRLGFGFGFRGRGMGTNFTNSFRRPGFTNSFPGGPGFVRGGFPPAVDWQRDAKFYQFWARASASGQFTLRNVRPGTYTLHAIADGVLGEFTVTNVTVCAGDDHAMGQLHWTPERFGKTVWQIGVPDRTAREFRHGDHYWQWGLYFDYPKEFPNDVDFVIGKCDWQRDWNYVQPPRIETRDVAVVSEEEELGDSAATERTRLSERNVRSSTWSIEFEMPGENHGHATLRLAFCGTHAGCNVEVFVNGTSIGNTGPLPSTSAMQRDGIRAYWVEKDLGFEATLLNAGKNQIKLLSHANSWSQGVMYDCVRLELRDAN